MTNKNEIVKAGTLSALIVFAGFALAVDGLGIIPSQQQVYAIGIITGGGGHGGACPYNLLTGFCTAGGGYNLGNNAIVCNGATNTRTLNGEVTQAHSCGF